MVLFILFTVLILIAAVLLILVVLVQNSKGGGLASNFAGSNQYLGVRKTADFLEKFTWTLAVSIPKYKGGAQDAIESEIIENIENLPVSATEPFIPTTTDQPAETNQQALPEGE